MKLNENEELLEVKLSNEEGILTNDDEKELTDEDFMEYNEFIEQQHEIDNEVI